MKKVFGISTIVALLAPAVASAQTTAVGIGGVLGLLQQANVLINRLIPFVIALTVLVFLWGVFRFVISGGDGDSRKEAQGYMIWGIIALFVMVSVWGLVNILVKSFNLDPAAPAAPQMPAPGGQYTY